MGTNLRSAAIQALEALEWAWGGEPLTGKEMVAIAALRAALAEPEQEPVARHAFNVFVTGRLHEVEPTASAFDLGDGKHALYTAPTPHQEPHTSLANNGLRLSAPTPQAPAARLVVGCSSHILLLCRLRR